MKLNCWIAVLVLFLAPVMVASAQEFSESPLETNVLMDRATYLVDYVGFNNYLADNFSKIKQAQVQSLQEHTYLLIDSVMKDRKSERRLEFEDFERNTLIHLFDWATRLNVIGSDLVSEYLQSKPVIAPQIFGNFSAALKYPLIEISQNSTWTVSVPFYFMITNVQTFVSNDKFTTSIVQASTSFAGYTKGKGNSQSTILFLYTPSNDFEKFRNSWIGNFKIAPSERVDDPVSNGEELYLHYDEAADMNMKLYFRKQPTGTFCVAYLGKSGPFEANMVSFSDFVKSIRYLQ